MPAIAPEHAEFLPAVGPVVEADTSLALRRHLEHTSATLPRADRATIERYLLDPAAFRLRDDPADDAFLDATSDFVAARLIGPWLDVATTWIAAPTWRGQPDGEAATVAALAAVADDLDARVAAWNAATPARHALSPFRWRDPDRPGDMHVFGASLGAGARRLVLLAHVDTVGPIDDDWQPFDARLVVEPWRDRDELLLRGRGAVDDKGPAAMALLLLEGLRGVLADSTALDAVRFEVAFDTAEETSMILPAWIDATGHPEMGVVLDSIWSVFAEKGNESSYFGTLPREDGSTGPSAKPAQLALVSLATPDGPANQIPATAEAVLAVSELGAADDLGRLEAALDLFAESWDGADRVITIWPAEDDATLTVFARGWGAAHGSAPDVNRAEGHNPLTCLCAFLAFCAGDPFPSGDLADDPDAVRLLDDDGIVAATDRMVLPRFVNWCFGREVFGEQHAEALRSADEIYEDGTTYAATRLDRRGVLSVDIRYALGHHATTWDRETYGKLEGGSRFRTIWTALTDEFNALLPPESTPMGFVTSSRAGPDIKDRGHPGWISLQRAYEETMGRPSPQLAIGGGTDAKGHLELFATGPNFGETMAEVFDAPVNYHGRDEAVVVRHIVDSARIVTRWALVEALTERE